MDAEAWRQAKVVLAEALLCPPADREALVAARCPDPGLRREVQAYLNQYDEQFLESVITVSDTLDSTSSSGEGQQLPDIRDGDHIGPYVVLDRLGVGGMGLVFLGNDTRLQRKVALKCLSASAPAAELRTRVLHEARAAARITHPNIAIVHDVIEHENRPFLVMEYVEGENLAVLIKRERPPLDTIVTFMRQLASALAAAHGKGIVHRDLKPANIQVTPEGSVKILDFGVAHAMSAAVSGAASLGASLTIPLTTSTLHADRRMMHPGTPAYMSPEQMFGRAIDQRSDIYSLGVIVYEMATGHRPYSTDDPLEVVLTLSRNFLRPGQAETSLPAQLNDIIGKMLAVKPEDRYQTAGELENALVALTASTVAGFAPARPARSAVQVAARGVAVAASVAIGITVLGFIETSAFNMTLGREAPFNYEPWWKWLQFGAQSLVLPLAYVLGLFIAAWGVRFVVRVLSLSRNIDQLLSHSVTRTTKISQRLGLDDPAVFGQAIAGVGLVLLAAVLWYFWPLVLAFGSVSISTKPAVQFLPLQSTGRARLDAQVYRFALVVLALAFAVASVRLQRLRNSQAVKRGRAALAMVVAMMCVAVIFCEWPYRHLLKNTMPRLDVAGERCFALGESGDQLLIHCPDHSPPRNRIVASSSVRRVGLIESIFDPPKTSP